MYWEQMGYGRHSYFRFSFLKTFLDLVKISIITLEDIIIVKTTQITKK